MRAAGGQTPVVLRAERSGRGGDCQWQRDAFCGGRIATQCRRAAAVIAPSPEIERELLEAGYSPALVRVIPNGVPDVPPRTPQTRRAARALLAEANQGAAIARHRAVGRVFGPAGTELRFGVAFGRLDDYLCAVGPTRGYG